MNSINSIPGFFINRKYKSLLNSAIILFLPLLLFILTVSPVFACNITIDPESAAGNVGDELSFTVTIQQTHRNCSIPIEDTQIKLTGVTLISETQWQKVSSLVYRKQITVRLVDPGEGSIEVIRICPKGGEDEIAFISITDSPSVIATPVETGTSAGTVPGDEIADSDSGIAAPLMEITELSSPAGEIQEPTWLDAFIDAVTQPQIIALLILIIIAIIAMTLKYRRFRYVVLLASVSYLGFAIGGCPCALGALQNVIIRIGEIKTYLVNYLQLGIPVIATVIFGRVFCGWVCPMGAVQNFLYRKELGKNRIRFDAGPRIHSVLRYMKYLILVVMLAAVALTGTQVLTDIDPFKALFNLDFSLWLPTLLLIILLLVSLFVGFPWCKYICPLGAFLTVFSKFTVFKVKIGETCTNCKACQNTFCDYGAIKAGEVTPEVNQMECMRCGECISRCPNHAIKLTSGRD